MRQYSDKRRCRTYDNVVDKLQVDWCRVGDKVIEARHVALGLVLDAVGNRLKHLGNGDQALGHCGGIDALFALEF
jgi:L-asparaginase II